MSLGLATWNVHAWLGTDGMRDPERGLSLIQSLEADVVALQEVAGPEWAGLARRAGFEVVELWMPGAPFGSALLLRKSPIRVERIDLSVPTRESRGALDATVPTPAGRFRIIATHLGLRHAERRQQVRWLAEHLRDRDRDRPLAVMGDLNDWTPHAGQLAPLARTIGRFSRRPTFPSWRPVLALDRMAWRAPGLVGRVAEVRRLRHASDHLPLVLRLEETGRS